MKEKYDHRLLLKHLPSDFKQFMEHLQVLEYADKPDYGQFSLVSTCSYVIILFPAMISGIFERTMKRRGVRESDPFDWEKVSFLQQRHDNYHRDNNRQDNHYDHHHNHNVEPRLGATAQRAKGSVQETLRSRLRRNQIK